MTSEAKIENNLFNDKKMEEFIQLYDDALTVNADCDPISYWIKKLENDELKSEKANYLRFFKIILENMLGYQIADIDFEGNIGDEGRPVEFTLKKGEKDYVVVELKGTTCKDLNKRYNREQSPIEQVTNYASIKEETQWAFVSNYNEFRLFNPSYREKYISFKFKQLSNPEVLKKFLLIFSKFSLIEKDIPQTLLKETKIIERKLEDEFYKLFSETRLMLIKELENSSEAIDRIEAIRFAQLILNRFIFLCFAEDLRLIPSETTADVILTPIKHKNLFDFTMWDRLNELFRFADKGNEERGIGAFNGGLFKENLRHLEIRDKVEDLTFFDDCYKTWKFEEKYAEIESSLGVYKNTLNPIYKNLLLISSFDFGSELSVNILGHIFENSIGDIEELKDETTKRRKKDGVFYTPEHITEYICRNTIIPYLSISGNANTTHELIKEYEDSNSLDELDKKLKEIKIIDISCGSGAFLNKAVDILFEIHNAYHDSKYANDTSLNKYFDNLDHRKQIIINNIYGVDLNEESVEITKLSLFLKLATSTGVEHGFKLPNLDKNILCGNSLINDNTIAKDKAFQWNSEFKEVFESGGFDIVIGNPPYVRNEKIEENEKIFLANTFKCCTKATNLYVGFFEKSMDILKNNGILSFICSNKFATVDYGKKLREFLLKFKILQYNDYAGTKIFSDAQVDPCIIIIKNTKPTNHTILIDEKVKLPQNLLTKELWYFSSIEALLLKDKLYKKGKPLKDIKSIIINNGIKTGYNNAFYINEETKNDLINEDIRNEDIIKPLLVGKDIKPWRLLFKKQYIIFARQGIDIDKYPTIKNYLYQFKKELTPKKTRADEFGRKPGDYEWYEIQDKTDFYENFDKPKLIWSEMNKEISFVYDENGYYINNKCFFITSDDVDLKFLNGLFLSDLFKFLFMVSSSSLGSNTAELRKSYVKQVPIILSEEYICKISNVSTELIELNTELNKEILSFLNWIKLSGNIDISEKLEEYYTLSFDDFFLELKKRKYENMSIKKTLDMITEEFDKSLKIIKPLQKDILLLKDKLNQLVYELYGLTAEEIAIVENSFKE